MLKRLKEAEFASLEKSIDFSNSTSTLSTRIVIKKHSTQFSLIESRDSRGESPQSLEDTVQKHSNHCSVTNDHCYVEDMRPWPYISHLPRQILNFCVRTFSELSNKVTNGRFCFLRIFRVTEFKFDFNLREF